MSNKANEVHTLDGKRVGTVVSYDGRVLVMHLEHVLAPGQPFEFQVVMPAPVDEAIESPNAGSGLTIRVQGRTSSSRRVSPAVFEVGGRLVNLRREDNERLLAALS